MKSFFRYTAYFSIAFLLAGSLGYYSVRMFTKSAEEVILPELTGRNIIWVLETLTAMGLNAKLYGTAYDDTIPRHAVINQDPDPGTRLKKGRDVIIYLSKGPQKNVIPDLRHTPLKQARILLEEADFKLGRIAYTYSAETGEHQIMAQYPGPFSTRLKGSDLNLLVSRGPRPRETMMPDLKPLTLKQAASILRASGLEIHKIMSDADPGTPPGIVLSQTPEAGTHVTEDAVITLVVNDSEKGQRMDAADINAMHFFTHTLAPGFLKQHVRVEIQFFGSIIELYNEFLAPGQDVTIAVPAGTKTEINIYIDQTLVRTIQTNPWKRDDIPGENLWESLPLQSYQLISPDWETN